MPKRIRRVRQLGRGWDRDDTALIAAMVRGGWSVRRVTEALAALPPARWFGRRSRPAPFPRLDDEAAAQDAADEAGLLVIRDPNGDTRCVPLTMPTSNPWLAPDDIRGRL